jgi:hypothetical protein
MALVKMHHDDPIATAGPTTADVPEEAVSEWQKHGWYLKPEDQPKPKPAKKAKAKVETEPETEE